MGFEVGKKVIALEDSPNGDFKKDDIFKVRAVSEPICKCKAIRLDIGIRNTGFNWGDCNQCGWSDWYIDSILWYSSQYFAPLDEQELSDTSVEEFLEKMEVAELVER